MKDPTDPHRVQNRAAAEPDCPLGLSRHACGLRGGDPDPHADATYSEARRQGIYLAACIIDEVAALGADSPEAVVDEIRRRICELVRDEFNGYAAQGHERG